MIAVAEDDIANGRVAPMDAEEMKQEVRARLAAEGIID